MCFTWLHSSFIFYYSSLIYSELLVLSSLHSSREKCDQHILHYKLSRDSATFPPVHPLSHQFHATLPPLWDMWEIECLPSRFHEICGCWCVCGFERIWSENERWSLSTHFLLSSLIYLFLFVSLTSLSSLLSSLNLFWPLCLNFHVFLPYTEN